MLGRLGAFWDSRIRLGVMCMTSRRVWVQLAPSLNPGDHAISQFGEVWVNWGQLLSYLHV